MDHFIKTADKEGQKEKGVFPDPVDPLFETIAQMGVQHEKEVIQNFQPSIPLSLYPSIPLSLYPSIPLSLLGITDLPIPINTGYFYSPEQVSTQGAASNSSSFN